MRSSRDLRHQWKSNTISKVIDKMRGLESALQLSNLQICGRPSDNRYHFSLKVRWSRWLSHSPNPATWFQFSTFFGSYHTRHHQTLAWKSTLPYKTADFLNFCGTRHGGNSLIEICADVAARQKPEVYFCEPRLTSISSTHLPLCRSTPCYGGN